MGNNSSNIVLSICLATYNQPDKVKRFFESLIPQLSPEVCPQIEIIVRDDSPGFEIKELIENYSKKISVGVRYFHGKKEGLDVAIIFLTQNAKGDYIWWFGDDFLEKGAVSYILNLIKNYKDLSLIYINSRDTNNNSIAFDMGGDKFFKDKNQVIEEIADNLGYITATLFERRLAIPFLEPAKKYIGTAWVNLYVILSVVANGNKFYFVNFPYIIGDPRLPDEPSWYDGFIVFAINFWHIVDAVKAGFDKDSIWRLLNNNVWKISRGILVYKAKGYRTGLGSPKANVKNLFPLYWEYPMFWLMAPLLLMPKFMVKFAYLIYKRALGIRVFSSK